jgi:hypothetical protein
VGFAEHDEVVQRFATYRADEPFDVSVLPYMDSVRLQEPLLFLRLRLRPYIRRH